MAAIEIVGLRDFRRELARADRSLSNEMRKVHRRVSDLVGDRARGSMSGRQASKAAAGVKSRSTNNSAFIETVAKPPYTLAVIWGMRRRSGWYAAPRYASSPARQAEPWVGNQWDPGEHGGKPYYIGDAINGSIDDVERIYMDGMADLFRRAFPD